MRISNQKKILLVISIFCFIALFDGLPYGYFTFLRFTVFGIFTYMTYVLYHSDKNSLWVWVFGFIAVLFNPFIPVYLDREIWWFIDLVIGIFLLLLSIFKFEIIKHE